MNKKWIIHSALYMSLFCLTGCTILQPRYPVKIDSIPQPELPAPQSFTAVQSVVFTFHGRSMTGIGTLSLDRATRSFELSCMTPVGMKLFDLRVRNNQPEILFALPFFEEKEGFAEAVALDISRIYFDNKPPNKDDVFQKGDLLLFDIDLGDRAMEYTYTGEPPQLITKQYCGLKGVETKIHYIRYADQDGFRYIDEAHLESKLYGYQLTVRTKKLTIHP